MNDQQRKRHYKITYRKANGSKALILLLKKMKGRRIMVSFNSEQARRNQREETD